MRATACLLLLVLGVASSLPAQWLIDAAAPPTAPHERAALPVAPSCSPHPVATTGLFQVVAGLVGGGGSVVAATYGAFMIDAFLFNADRPRATRLAWELAFPTYVLGSAVIVYGVGNSRGHAGRFWPTLLGSVIGLGSPGATVAYHISDPTRRECAASAAEPVAAAAPAPSSSAAPPRAEILLFQLRF